MGSTTPSATATSLTSAPSIDDSVSNFRSRIAAECGKVPPVETKTRRLNMIGPDPGVPTKSAYKDAGVDAAGSDAGLSRLAKNILGTWTVTEGMGKVRLPLGYFANVIDFNGTGLALCTDGVGSKALIAQMLGKYDTIGIDCVAMNVNDLVCVGATPRTMVDYIAVEAADPALLEALSVGLAKGADISGISISGGEIAQLRDMLKGHGGCGFDIVGMAAGDVPLDRILIGGDIEEGDAVVGIASNGIHSNGLSLARHAFFDKPKFSIHHVFDELDCSIGEELLKPTHIYVREALEILRDVSGIKAFIHVTGDGLMNLARVASAVGYVIDALPAPPPIFNIIQRLASVGPDEMFQVFNMGIGFCVVVEPEGADKVLSILRNHGRKAQIIGHAVSDPEKRVILKKEKLVGQGKRFSAA
jgi:phosphoribosylformylglycinamidine cyclo-ligase